MSDTQTQEQNIHDKAVIRKEDLATVYSKKKPRILSGMRPTGKLHIGHFVGALEPWVKLQDIAENFHLIADYHALTTNLDSSHLTDLSVDMAIDWIAAGIDPEHAPIFRQSQIKEHAELFLLFSMLISKNRLERNPAVKDQVRDLGIDERMTYGHLGYPVLQAADILLYRGDLVPVGEDQVPHVEITREFARDFNNHYGNVFPVTRAFLSEFPRLPGVDGKRMSKSVGNTILLSDSPEDTQKKLKPAFTDPQKLRKGDPGRPEVCLIYSYHEKWNAAGTEEIYAGCTSGALGCVDCKKKVGEKINESFEPIREKRKGLEQNPQHMMQILINGEDRARAVAAETMKQVHDAMKFG